MIIPDTRTILAALIGFPTISRQSNLALLDYVEALLAPADILSRRFTHEDGSRANLWASIGPGIDGGIVLSGHSDVVPVTGQAWQSDPFTLHEAEGRYYGRGTVDMKGFLAVAIRTMLQAAGAVAEGRPLHRPLHLAISYDEEVGCLGVRSMIAALAAEPLRPALCIVGEPTSMRIATGHKGKTALRACCHGQTGHSALAPLSLNALHLGARFIGALEACQNKLAGEGARDAAYDIPYTTIHAGVMQGGTALNIVPEKCEIDFEIRNIMADQPEMIISELKEAAEGIVAPFRTRFPSAFIGIETLSSYPGLETDQGEPMVATMRALLGNSDQEVKVAFGTEGGLFQEGLGIPVLICGPGDMDQGHKPDEYVEITQLAACEAFLAGVLDVLTYNGLDAARV